MIYCTPIWDVLAPEGMREGAGEHLTTGARSRTFPIRQAVPVGLAQGFAARLIGLSTLYLKHYI
jgi:hypothetical protein